MPDPKANNNDLHVKYRPTNLEEFVGNESAVKVLKGFIDNDNIPHCILFEGPRGTGKTSLARMLADYLNCSPFNFKEYGTADDTSTDSMKAVVKLANQRPNSKESKTRIFFIDEIHNMKAPSFKIILKATEEPKEFTYFFFATTEPESLPSDFRSRCTRIKLSALSKKDIVQKVLKPVCVAEKIKIDGKVANLIAKQTEGIPREALILLNQIRYLDQDVQLDQINKHQNATTSLGKVVYSYVYGKCAKIDFIKAVNDLDTNPESIRFQILGILEGMYFNSEKYASMRPKIANMSICFSESYFHTLKMGLAQSIEDLYE